MNDFAKNAQDEPIEGGSGSGPGSGGEAATSREAGTPGEAATTGEAATPGEAGAGSEAAADKRQHTASADERQDAAPDARRDAAAPDERQDAASAEPATGQHQVPGAPVTGEAAVDDALARLGQIAEAPTAQHVEIYDDVHRSLTDTLADVDED